MKELNLEFSENSSTTLYLIRVIAAQLVTIGHGLGIVLKFKFANIISGLGLAILFLISGLLISYSLFNKMSNDNYNFKLFLINRFSRIYPPLIASLMFLLIFDGCWFRNPKFYNVFSFLFSLFLLNDNALGIPAFGSARPAWALPLFWWTYLIFGWLILGQRSKKKKYFYFILLAFFSFMLIFIYHGTIYHSFYSNLKFLFLWVSGVPIIILLNNVQKIIPLKPISSQNRISHQASDKLNNKNWSHLKTGLRLTLASLLALAIINLIIYKNPYNFYFFLLLIGILFFILLYTQSSTYHYPKKFIKAIKFMASYTFTLYLIHYTIFSFIMLFRYDLNNIILFFISYILTNVIAIGIAYPTEMRYKKINRLFVGKLISNRD
jgi:peptidoglycan/LPS O-acetylase OafA/YrhL